MHGCLLTSSSPPFSHFSILFGQKLTSFILGGASVAPTVQLEQILTSYSLPESGRNRSNLLEPSIKLQSFSETYFLAIGNMENIIFNKYWYEVVKSKKYPGGLGHPPWPSIILYLNQWHHIRSKFYLFSYIAPCWFWSTSLVIGVICPCCKYYIFNIILEVKFVVLSPYQNIQIQLDSFH